MDGKTSPPPAWSVAITCSGALTSPPSTPGTYATDASRYFRIPVDRAVEIGARIDI
jgi:hypothetical protein